MLLERLSTHDDLRHVAHIDRVAVACCQKQKPDVGNALKRLARNDGHGAALIADLARKEGAVRRAHLVHELRERHAVKRKLLGIRFDPNLIGPAADDVGEADIVDLGKLDPQILGEMIERVVGPALGGFGLRRERQADDGNIVDAARDDQRLRNADGDAVHVGAHLLMHAQNGFVRFRADEKARGHEHLVVIGLAVDVLDAVDGFDDGLQRLRHEPRRILRLEAIGANLDIDHRHGDLRLFLARKLNKGDAAQHQGGKQNKRRQRGGDERLCEVSRYPELHGRTSLSPGFRPASTSTPSPSPSSRAGWPGWTTTSMVLPPSCMIRA